MPLQTIPPDPLGGYSGLSLFARTFASLPNPPRPYDPDDLQHSHDFLKSMPLPSSNKLIEQAKAIVVDSSELLNSDMLSISDAEVKEKPRERRPGLGRKRARFSLKPNSSQPIESLVPPLDIDKLKDPEEFFMAFERAENAKREIQRQTGVVLMDDYGQNVQSLAAPPRRPGMLRRTVKYKHRYSTAVSPVESVEEEIHSPLYGSQQEKSDMNDELQEKELVVLANNAENKVDELLDHLLEGNYDGDDAISLLQERLQIKPIELENICLPDLQNIRRIDLKASRGSLTKPGNSISDLMKGISKRTPKQQAGSSVHSLGSPTLSRSPLASISLLKKQMSQSNALNDPFSADGIDQSPVTMENICKQPDHVDKEKELSVTHNNNIRSPQQQAESSHHHLASPTPPRNPLASMSLQKKHTLQSDPPSTDNIDKSPGRNASPIESINKQSSQVGTLKEVNMSHMLRSPILEANQTTATANASSELDGRDFAVLFDKFVNDNASGFDSGINVVSSVSQADLENNNLNRPEVDADSHTIKSNESGGRVEDVPSEDIMEDIPSEAVASAQTELDMDGPTIDNLRTIQGESDDSTPAMDEDHAMDGSLRAAETGQKLNEQQKKKGKAKPRPSCGRERKTLSRRQSLAGSGTSFDGEGRRRSTRIRSRPLEFWKGERFLYGRIHSSLSTVIGIKYESPGKADGENPSLRVKSFVSDEYKDLVELAARF